MKVISTLLATGLCAALLGCPAKSAEATGGEPTSATKTLDGEPASTKVARIVFIDKEEACACTRERATASYAELTKALGPENKRPLERIYIDSQHDKAAPYLALSPLVTIPGIYLLAADGSLVELLQGEVNEDQIARRL